MNLEPDAEPNIITSDRSPVELLRDTEGLLRRKTVATLVPILPQNLATNLQKTSLLAENSLQQLAEIELEQITDDDLQASRIIAGLTFVGFGALTLAILTLYLYSLHPELSTIEQVRNYWHQYIWLVSLGVAGMFMLGREAMR
ncbi:hypothetical protein [Aliterella atlantica]|uniref:Uncharacterized protein n=1 Tax=Aliterella atlantica CENA595 TaxID=1618023 RepID=A0A0D8ZTX0_9CYAN|nr:hypothetical protein [Aliterella atlantica]KJH71919.1 hypothetical protein UH38_09305 [Aliterella atlantica CENA595]